MMQTANQLGQFFPKKKKVTLRHEGSNSAIVQPQQEEVVSSPVSIPR